MKSVFVKLGIILVVIGLFIFGNSETFSFDIDGFKSGMTQKEVMKMLEGGKVILSVKPLKVFTSEQFPSQGHFGFSAFVTINSIIMPKP